MNFNEPVTLAHTGFKAGQPGAASGYWASTAANGSDSGIVIDQLFRSKRRTIGLEIGSDARLVVRAPLRTPLYLIRRAVENKKAWIIRKQWEMREKRFLLVPKRFVAGESIAFLGKNYPLSVAGDALFPLAFDGGRFILNSCFHEKAADVIASWYREQAEAVIFPRVRHFAGMFGIPVQRLKISGARRRWGSCSAKNGINFSWRLVMAPVEVIDYVAVHELAHIKEKNHSRRFWARVAAMLPDYRRHRQWLRDNGHTLIS